MPWYIHAYNIGWSFIVLAITYYIGIAYMLLLLYIMAGISIYWIG
jgi:hypothetical protein